jgi:hypothetical protein
VLWLPGGTSTPRPDKERVDEGTQKALLVDPGAIWRAARLKTWRPAVTGLKCAYRKFYLKSIYYE